MSSANKETMLLREVIYSAAILIGVTLAGCDDPKPQPAAPAPTTAPSRSLKEDVSHGIEQGKRELEDLTRRAAEEGKELIEEAKPHVQAATQEIRRATTQASEVIGDQVRQLTNATTRAAGASAAEINQKIELALRYVKERKLELADKTLEWVEQRGGELSAATQARVATVRQMIDAAMQARNVRQSAPAMPVLPELP